MKQFKAFGYALITIPSPWWERVRACPELAEGVRGKTAGVSQKTDTQSSVRRTGSTLTPALSHQGRGRNRPSVDPNGSGGFIRLMIL